MERLSVILLAAVLVVGLAMAGKRAPRMPTDPRDVPREAQLTTTRAKHDLDRDGRFEALVLVNALTGEHQPERAAEVILGIIGSDDSDGAKAAMVKSQAKKRKRAADRNRGELLWVRHVMKDTGKPAHDGEITAFDLDGDGVTELMLSWDRSISSEQVDRWAEIYSVHDAQAPRKVWEGVVEKDTRRDSQTPASQREHFRREIDFSATRAAIGRAIVFTKTHRMIAGKSVEPPRATSERFEMSLRALGS